MFRFNINRSRIRRAALLGAAAITTGTSLISALPAGAQTESGKRTAAARSIENAIRSHALKDYSLTDAELRDLMARTNGILQKYCDDPSTGSLDAYNTMVKGLAGLVVDLVKDRPNGSESQREAAFKTVSVIYFAMLFGGISLPPAGALIGTGVGAIAGLPVADLGGATIPSGLLIGLGSGIVLSAGEVTLATMIIYSTSMEINDKFPPKDPEPSAGTSSTRVQGLTAAGATATRHQAQAGPYESFLVNLICTAFSDRLLPLAAKWDAAPGLSSAQRDFLKMFKGLQPIIQQIAQVKTTRKLAPNAATAMLPAAWMDDVEKILSADTAVQEQGWLGALGLGTMEASVTNGRLTVTMPAVLRAVGAPAAVHNNLDNISLKVGGNGGAFDPYIRCKVTPGDFDIKIGDVTIIRSGPDKDKIKVTYTVKHGSRLGSASLGFKWNGPEQSLSAFAPSLTKDATADAILRVSSQGLLIDHIELGPLKFGYAFPLLPDNIPGISDLVKAISSSLETALQDMMKNVFGMGPAMAAFGTYPASSVASALNAAPETYGVGHVSKVESLMIQNGKLKAKVLATGTSIAINKQMLQQMASAYRSKAMNAAGLSGTGLRGRVGRGNLQP